VYGSDGKALRQLSVCAKSATSLKGITPILSKMNTKPTEKEDIK
jgi:hypothetical protein